MESVRCAVCGKPVPLDEEHVRVEAEHVPRTEWANVDEYAAHADCWREASGGWNDPA